MDQGDFFISYCQRDRDWAEWIAWQLQEVGYRVFLQAWHIGPGRNWVRDMGQGMENCRHTIAVLSPEYLNSPYCRAEWQAAFEYDPEGNLRKLIPVRIAECTPTGMLRQVVHFDLIGIDDEDAAREELLRNVRSAWEKEGGLAPKKRPGFPPAQGTRTEPPEPDPAGTPGTPAAVTPDTGLTLPLPPTQRPITSRPTFPPEVAGWRRAARALRTALTRGWVVLPTLAAAIVIGIAFQVADGGPGGVLVGSLVAALAAAAPAFMLFPPTDRTATLVVGGACVVGALGGGGNRPRPSVGGHGRGAGRSGVFGRLHHRHAPTPPSATGRSGGPGPGCSHGAGRSEQIGRYPVALGDQAQESAALDQRRPARHGWYATISAVGAGCATGQVLTTGIRGTGIPVRRPSGGHVPRSLPRARPDVSVPRIEESPRCPIPGRGWDGVPSPSPPW
ncbi:toll/interleukin-1 receptor domain-containing protein [Frankia casuarinae]|uniref:toll/interleukin-1 receptor domain-containing protein n=1 Tax=Frankia casuarinae (strain DSM 45818 / CECT 9043 / HFP020203 / CcI3) TaxID=106370 RepID=UPI0007BF4B59|nr:toll/interleukin-1 receptor domain-containing protein [Frankia casuarinae]OAA24797.1 TIR domain-containing protein [Frankia casuarinae]